MPRPDRTAAAARAFTLVELFVIVCILALLGAILFPVLAPRRGEYPRPSCAAREKQILLAMLNYAQDYDGRYPPAVGAFQTPDGKLHEQQWGLDVPRPDGTVVPGIISDFVGNPKIFRCPAVPPGTPLTYRYNDLIAGTPMFQVLRPGESVALSDGEGMLRNAGHSRAAPGEDPAAVAVWNPNGAIRLPLPAEVTDAALTRHNGGCSYAFADGHVRWCKPDSVFFPPRSDRSPDHRDPRAGAASGPDPEGDMTFRGRQYAATFHIR